MCGLYFQIKIIRKIRNKQLNEIVILTSFFFFFSDSERSKKWILIVNRKPKRLSPHPGNRTHVKKVSDHYLLFGILGPCRNILKDFLKSRYFNNDKAHDSASVTDNVFHYFQILLSFPETGTMDII